MGRVIAGRLVHSLALASALVAAGCAPEAVDPLAPPEIHYGEHLCDQCGMTIDDPRYAAATLVDDAGQPSPRRFDDIGDMVVYHAERPELVVLRWYVHDFDSGEWLDATTAAYVRAPASVIPSPMGFGVIAFGDAETASAQAEARGGQVLTFDALPSIIAPVGAAR